MKHEIKSIAGTVLYTAEIPDDTPSGLFVRSAMEKATAARANLRGAYLGGADLRGADLGGAYLRGADLRGAYLRGAYLGGANLRGAYLGGADLRGAYLGGANLRGAYLGGADLRGAYLGDAAGKLVGDLPILQIGPIGSRSDFLIAFLAETGVFIRAGCFFGSLDEFREAVEETHGDSDHGKEYQAAMFMIEAHAEIWMPAPPNAEPKEKMP